jgi:hypothetical protein
MTRKFKTANYEETLNLSVTLREVLPSNHLARFVVDVIAGLSPVLVARLGGRCGRVGSSVFGVQSQTLAYAVSDLRGGFRMPGARTVMRKPLRFVNLGSYRVFSPANC